MLSLINLAWRNVFRNVRRSVITFITIAMAIMALAVIKGMMDGIAKQSEKIFIDLETSHCKIFAEGYNDNEEGNLLDYSLSNPAMLMNQLKEYKEIEGITERIVFSVMLNDGVNEVPSMGIGINLNTDKDVFKLEEYLIEGEYIKENEDISEANIIIGSRLAVLLELGIGDYITIVFRTLYGGLEAWDVMISGIISTGSYSIDNAVFYISLPIAQQMLEMDNSISEIAIRFESDNNLNERLDKVNSILKNGENGENGEKIEILSWKKLVEDFLRLHKMKTVGSNIMLALIVILSSVGIVNTMVMASFERTREIGMLMALGMRGIKISILFLIEGALIGLLGSIIGCFIGGAITYYWATVGYSLGGSYEDMDIGYPIKDIFYSDFNIITLFGILIFGVFISVLASWYPAHRAANLNPVDALRYV